MCIVLYKPNHAPKPDVETIERCWRANDDGAGLMYPDVEGKLTISKGFMNLKDFMKAYRAIPDSATFVAHFRIRTHGHADPLNTHPFWLVDGQLGMAHNGILPIAKLVDDNSPHSDTATLAMEVLAHFPENWWKNPYFCHLVEEYMGYNNKIIIMHQSGVTKILNEKAGTWSEGVWYSNQGFRPPYVAPVTPYSASGTVRPYHRNTEYGYTYEDSEPIRGFVPGQHARHRQPGATIIAGPGSAPGKAPADDAGLGLNERIALGGTDPDLVIDDTDLLDKDGNIVLTDDDLTQAELDAIENGGEESLPDICAAIEAEFRKSGTTTAIKGLTSEVAKHGIISRLTRIKRMGIITKKEMKAFIKDVYSGRTSAYVIHNIMSDLLGGVDVRTQYRRPITKNIKEVKTEVIANPSASTTANLAAEVAKLQATGV